MKTRKGVRDWQVHERWRRKLPIVFGRKNPKEDKTQEGIGRDGSANALCRCERTQVCGKTLKSTQASRWMPRTARVAYGHWERQEGKSVAEVSDPALEEKPLKGKPRSACGMK